MLNFSVFKVFEALKDIESYPDFLKYVKAVDVLSDEFENSGTIYAEVSLLLAFCIVSYRCRISFSVPYEIRIQGFASEDFNYVSGNWRLKPIDDFSTEVSFNLQFELFSTAQQKVAEFILETKGDSIAEDLKILCKKKLSG